DVASLISVPERTGSAQRDAVPDAEARQHLRAGRALDRSRGPPWFLGARHDRVERRAIEERVGAFTIRFRGASDHPLGAACEVVGAVVIAALGLGEPDPLAKPPDPPRDAGADQVHRARDRWRVIALDRSRGRWVLSPRICNTWVAFGATDEPPFQERAKPMEIRSAGPIGDVAVWSNEIVRTLAAIEKAQRRAARVDQPSKACPRREATNLHGARIIVQ